MMIIKATLNHLNDLFILFDQYMVFYEKPSDPTKYGQYLMDRLTNNEATIYLAYNENDPIGFVLNYHTFSSVALGKIIVLNDLYVIPSARKKGLAEQLINKSFELAECTGAIRVDLGTAKDNSNAQRLYEKIGFVRDNDFYAYSYNI